MHTTFTRRAPKRMASLLAVALGGVVIAACGDDPALLAAPADTPTTVPASAPPSPTAEPTAPVADAAVKISQTELGDVLADPRGMTLYGFTNDVDATSTCAGTCAEAWPPVIVEPDFIVSPGLDTGIFATTQREDGSHQLVAGKWPLYLYAADAKPGDVTGHGSGDVWFAVDTSGRLISDGAAAATTVEPTSETTTEVTGESGAGGFYDDRDYGDPVEPTSGAEPTGAEPSADAAPLVTLGDTSLGQVLTDADGFTLYLFTSDEAGSPTCAGGCATAWPPLLVEDGAELVAAGVDPSLLSTVPHPDGGTQLKLAKWPLYRFSGDVAPGDTTGQGSGGSWFVLAADGTAIM